MPMISSPALARDSERPVATGFHLEPLTNSDVLISFQADDGTTVNTQVVTREVLCRFPVVTRAFFIAVNEGEEAAAAFMSKTSQDSRVAALKRYCDTLLPGPVADVHSLELMLGPVWDTLPSDDPSMTGNKLLNRMERPIWNPPVLTFRIERHPATVHGSSRAEVQEWTVDLERLTTTVNIVGRRQVSPTQPRFDMKPVAAELCSAIIAGNQDDRLKWDGTSKVRVLIGKVLPERSAVKDTLAGRRKRLRDELTRLLEQARWKLVRPNVYERQK